MRTPMRTPSRSQQSKAKAAAAGSMGSPTKATQATQRWRVWRKSSVLFFVVAYLWHHRGVEVLYRNLSTQQLAQLAMFPEQPDVFGPGPLRMSQSDADHFALLGAGSHTAVMLCGLELADRGALALAQRTRVQRAHVALTLAVALAAAFAPVAWRLSHFVFEARVAPIFDFAKLFFREADGGSPFAWTSAVSYTCAFASGLALGLDAGATALTLDGLGSLVALAGAVDHMSLRGGVPAVAPLLVPEAEAASAEAAASWDWKRDWHWASSSAAAAAVMPLLALGFSAAFVFAALRALRPHVPGVPLPTFVLRLATNVASFLLVAVVWNCHLIAFWGCFGPFHLLAWSDADDDYEHADAFRDGWIFVLFVAYGFAVAGRGSMKIFSVKLRRPWGPGHDFFLTFLIVAPAMAVLSHSYGHGRSAFGVHCALTAVHLAYVSFTWPSRPEYSGSRQWLWLQLSPVWGLLEHYFDQGIIVDGCGVNTRNPARATARKADWSRNRSNYDYDEAEADANANADADADFELVGRVVGFHPHRLFPCTVIWACLTPTWREVFGTLAPRSLTDAMIHVIPCMREVAQWAGGLEVSREVVRDCLGRKETVMLVPGGQGEILCHSAENLKAKTVVLSARHRGFIKLALQQGADLVPSFSFGELQSLMNISCPPLQRLTRKVLGFPLPFFPTGVFGLLPIPNPVSMTYVLGRPMPAKEACAVPGHPTEREVEVMHKRYYAALANLFDKYKADAGYADWAIVMNFDH